MVSNFGKYDIPPTLQRLIDLQNVLEDEEQFYLGLNFYLSLEDFRYFNTPSDVVVFGNIGMDGIHYGFLTDFSSVADLEVAPIVCVSPMDFERPTRIVAKNLCEFLRVNLSDGELFYNQFESEEKYLDAKNQWITEAANSPFQPSENEMLIREKVTNKKCKRQVANRGIHFICKGSHLAIKSQKSSRILVKRIRGIRKMMEKKPYRTEMNWSLHSGKGS